MVLLWQTAQAQPECPSRQVIEHVAQQQVVIAIGVRQVNRLRVRWQVSRRRGRPRRVARLAASSQALVRMEPHLSYVGLHVFAQWAAAQATWAQALTRLQQAIAAYSEGHAEEDFPLLRHRAKTLEQRWLALLYAPLLGIGKLTEFDQKEHPLPTLVGRGYQSSTLTQFLGQLERIDAAAALMPILTAGATGLVAYVDGHMIAFWTQTAMHKGKITMLGRIMAGSQAVIAHDGEGQALWVDYSPPDVRLTVLILAYCEQVVARTGIRVFVIDREINSAPLAARFAERQWGLLSMLDKNEYKGLDSWTTTRMGQLDDGSSVYEATWKEPRPGDVREFVLVDTGERVLAYWGTPAVGEVFPRIQWPGLYRARTQLQEHQFKRMIAHGALNVNYGIKKITGPDRHQLRARAELEAAQAVAAQKVAKTAQVVGEQAEKVAESQAKGHGRRLAQRQQRLAQAQAARQKACEKKAALEEKIAALDAPGERADRDFRKQRIMTFRTVLLENLLLSFLAALCTRMWEAISLEGLLTLLFARSGAYVETSEEITYWLNATGLSQAYRGKLVALAQALTALNLTCRGKPIRIRVRDGPPDKRKGQG